MTKLEEKVEQQQQEDHAAGPPEVRSDVNQSVFHARLAAAIQWFLDYDPRVAIIRHPFVEGLFQWKQTQLERESPQIYRFNTAEDRLAIGIFEALRSNADERSLHTWIKDLLQALDDSTKLNEEIAGAYKLSTKEGASALIESNKIPTERERDFYLNACWLEALCTAEARVLGWIYQGLYSRPFNPGSFEDHG